ncbi:MAG: hypothetical protein ACRCYY_06140 [Trueperaceae bacterium]
MTNFLDHIDQDLKHDLEEAIETHPEFEVFLQNPNASVEALETLQGKNKRAKRRIKDDGLEA